MCDSVMMAALLALRFLKSSVGMSVYQVHCKVCGKR